MSMKLWIALRIWIGIMQQLGVVQSIIVERNLHSYYRLPISAVRRTNMTQEYYILQCPFKSSLQIPKPKDMDICTIAGRYKDEEKDKGEKIKPVVELTGSTAKKNGHSKAEHRNLKAPKEVKWIKIKKRKPKKIVMLVKKPPKTKEYYKRPKTEITEQYKATNVRLYLDHPASASEAKITVNGKAVQVHDSQASGSSMMKPKMLPKPLQKPRISTDKSMEKEYRDNSQPQQKQTNSKQMDMDFIDDDSSESQERDKEDRRSSPNSPLKYLATKNVLKKLQLPHKGKPNRPLDKSEKFYAQSKKYKKGFKTKGYQNMYHRDEIYQDHIYYDDLQERGKYDIYKKAKKKF
ncbi:uncharacterized protein LOC101896301 [Musca domestica]|uniref:Uncharacterized protein LOC101896301 n=1 Tax=Musca domestica TaxID=7370 RepID=A0A9J7DKB7_MUSDO|nr:uncharacterized protein LOC101896301 [Musca domestica]